ncbi:MAG: threonylcarbamoyl-AMP synthase [Phycisphaerales bacterium]|nr:threonylcarbamoyl-AMP synthase [Phycisphaerales bacterium]
MMASIREPDDDAIRDAAARLRRGDVVAFPTETVYGIGASTFDAAAIRRVYALKGRPDDNPLIAHVADADGAARLTDAWPVAATALAAAFWPGPLTIIVPRAAGVPDASTAGRATIAIRCPRHDVARRLLGAFGGPISAPSANRSGHVSPTTAAHVASDFADVATLLILDGGPCALGIESTVVDLTTPTARVLRPGTVTVSAVRAVLGAVEAPEIVGPSPSPGTRSRHYAPHTPARVIAPAGVASALASCGAGERAVVLGPAGARVEAPHQLIVMPVDAAGYAAALYEGLRQADARGGTVLFIVDPSAAGDDDEESWRAVRDRLRRATTA